MEAPAPRSRPLLSIVIPLYDEQDNVAPLLQRTRTALLNLTLHCEIILVDDGSTDQTPTIIQQHAATDPNLRPLRLSRNFGHQAALFAGLEHARGDAVITMDGDLQHPPELIPTLVERWQAGHDVVQAVRRQTADAGLLKRATSRGFYGLLSTISRVNVTPGAADFRLMSRPAVDAFLACRERCRFNRGIVQWIGFSCAQIPYVASGRHAGRSKYGYKQMLRLAGDAVFSFSSWPLRLAGLAGAFISLAAAAYLLFVLWARFFTEQTVPGWSSLLATLLIIGGGQLIVLWILGEYLGRLYEEAKQRPLYIVRPSNTSPAPTATPSSDNDAPQDDPGAPQQPA